jgi:hypothetical protein
MKRCPIDIVLSLGNSAKEHSEFNILPILEIGRILDFEVKSGDVSIRKHNDYPCFLLQFKQHDLISTIRHVFLIDFVISDSEQDFCILEHYKISILGIEFNLLEKIKINAHVRNGPICSVQKISWLTTYIIQHLGYPLRQQFLRLWSDTIRKQS